MQLLLAAILSVIYALVQMLVVIGIALQMKREGLCSPSAFFLLLVVVFFLVAACLHPHEISCIVSGAIYFLAIPSMHLLLMIYAFCNMNDVSWGTREVKVETPPDHGPPDERKADGGRTTEEGGVTLSFGNLFRCICCPREVAATAGMTARRNGPVDAVGDNEVNVASRKEETTGDHASQKEEEVATKEREWNTTTDDIVKESRESGHFEGKAFLVKLFCHILKREMAAFFFST